MKINQIINENNMPSMASHRANSSDKQRYTQAARDIVKGADPDHIAKVRGLDAELLKKHTSYAWDKINSGHYKLNRPNLEEEQDMGEGKKPGLWANIHAKQERIKHGSGEHMRKPGSKGAPTADALKKSATESVAEGRENYNGVNILFQKDDDEIFVKASAGGRELGHVLFVVDGEYLMPQDLEVEERYRGQGIAQIMYDYVKSKGYKIRRSGQQTDAGAGFWDKHKPGKNIWEQGVAEGHLEELANTSLKVKEPEDMYNVNDRKQTTYKIFKFKSGKKTFLINFTVKSPPTYGKKQNWNAVIVSFGVKEKQDDYSFGDEMNTDLTGKNKNQFLIYSTVINTIRRFITEYNTEIDEIIMQGAGERQEAMYQRFFQSAPKYFPGWHYNGKHSLVRDVPRPTGKKVREQGVAEDDDAPGEEAGMASSELFGAAKHAKQLLALIRQHGEHGLEAWQQSKITKAADYLNAVLQSMDYESNGKQGVAEGENWSKHNNKRAGGMSKKSVSVYRNEHPGSKIQTAVTKEPSKIKKGSKDASRRKSFCARMKGMKKHRTGAKTAHDPNSNINKSLRRWHCESIEEMQQMIENAQNFINSQKQLNEMKKLLGNKK
jgi:hypothetical protein